MRVPEQVGIVGDNLRTSRIQARAGEPSSVVKLELAQVPDAQYRVLGATITSGDILYQAGAGPARLAIGTENKVLTVGSDGYPSWKESHVTHKVYYVTPEGKDTNPGNSITTAWRTVRHAVDNVTGPATI